MRPVQYFTDEYLAQCQQMTTIQILQFLEDFRLLFAESAAKQTAHPIEEEPPEHTSRQK